MAKKGYSFGALVDKVEADKVEVDGKIAKNVVDIAGKAPTSHTHTPNQVGLENVPNIVHTTNATKDTVVVRDNSGDVNARLIRSDYQDESAISGGLVFRRSAVDNYHRVCSNTTNIRNWLNVADKDTSYNYIRDLTLNDNLNNITLTGIYHNDRDMFATTANNYPEALAGKLEVFAGGAMVYQEYLTYNTNVLYTRCRYNSTWFSWKQAVNTELTATTNRAGIVRLNSSLTSTSQTEAATAGALKIVSDKLNTHTDRYGDLYYMAINTGLPTGRVMWDCTQWRSIPEGTYWFDGSHYDNAPSCNAYDWIGLPHPWPYPHGSLTISRDSFQVTMIGVTEDPSKRLLIGSHFQRIDGRPHWRVI